MRQKAMRTRACLVGSLLVGLVAFPTSAGDFDGSKLLICAPVEAMECVAGGACERSSPDEIGAPAFLRIDVARKAIVGPKRTSPIQFIEKTESQLLLQGTELGHGWTVALDQETGKMAVTLVNRDGAFVLFGACTVP
jgi:hypothetical protein